MKLIVFVLALALISWVVYTALNRTTTVTTVDANGNVVVQQGQADPKKQLDNVRGAADRIEQQQNERLDEAAKAGQ